MTRDWDATVPLLDTWELDSKTDEKRVYHHADRVARIVLGMDDELVTCASLQALNEDGEWTQNARVPDRDFADADADDHPNELVLHLETSFARKRDEFPLREPEGPENEDVEVVEEDDCVVVDNTDDSTQATLDELLEESDIIDADGSAVPAE